MLWLICRRVQFDQIELQLAHVYPCACTHLWRQGVLFPLNRTVMGKWRRQMWSKQSLTGLQWSHQESGLTGLNMYRSEQWWFVFFLWFGDHCKPSVRTIKLYGLVQFCKPYCGTESEAAAAHGFQGVNSKHMQFIHIDSTLRDGYHTPCLPNRLCLQSWISEDRVGLAIQGPRRSEFFGMLETESDTTSGFWDTDQMADGNSNISFPVEKQTFVELPLYLLY